MLQLTLQQMRLSAGRLLAAGLAIMLGTAFVAATFAGTTAMERTTFNALAASYGDADLVVEVDWDRHGNDVYPASKLAEIQSLAGVEAANDTAAQWWQVQAGEKSEMTNFQILPGHPRLVASPLADGALPSARSQVALADGVANRIGASVGDTVKLIADAWYASGDEGETTKVVEFTVTGILTDTGSALTGSAASYISGEDFVELSQFSEGEYYDPSANTSAVLVVVENGGNIDAVRADLEALFPDSVVDTPHGIAADRASDISGMKNPFTYVLLGFAAIALVVAALVISNTFQVLVAQRTRTLALLRCVGASTSQVKRSVRIEALILGLLASIVGLLAGVSLVQVLLRVVAHFEPAIPVSKGINISTSAVIITIVVGMLVTLFAASSPARAATKVAPLAALRPLEATPVAGGGSFRKVVSLFFIIVGLTGLGLGAYLGMGNTGLEIDVAILLGLAVGILGGISSLVGLLLFSIFLVPAIIRLMGRFGKRSVPWQVAIQNAVRNPRRTANTTNALVIGVALVMLFATGAATARNTLDAMLDDEFPMDISATSSGYRWEDTLTGLSPAQVSAIEASDGVATTALLNGARIDDWQTPDGSASSWSTLFVHTAPDLSQVLRTDHALTSVAPGQMVISSGDRVDYDLGETGTITLVGPNGSVELTYRTESNIGIGTPLVHPDTLTELGVEPTLVGIYAKLDNDADAMDVITDIQSTLTSLSEVDPNAPLIELSGSAPMRQAFGQVINILLLVVVGLLAVAVLIALIGVANTLSLSVLERRRESAMLRALGLTKSQLRRMLTHEGLLIACVGAFVGLIAGLIYGWAGAAVILGGIGQKMTFAIPWLEVGIIAVVAIVAGILASLVPSRSATKPSPIEALATD